MADIVRARPGDLVKCNVRGYIFIAEVQGATLRVGPRVYELPVQVIGGGRWARDATPTSHPPVTPNASLRVRGRQVETLYRQLKS